MTSRIIPFSLFVMALSAAACAPGTEGQTPSSDQESVATAAQPLKCLDCGGVKDPPEGSSAPYWGNFAPDGDCQPNGYRYYAAVLYGINGSWEAACAAEPATVLGQYFSHPDFCTNQTFNEWGHFRVCDDACGCAGLGVIEQP